MVIPLSQGDPATLRNEAISLMEASEGWHLAPIHQFPRPSHHYGGPSRIKIQSLLWLVWLRRASAQERAPTHCCLCRGVPWGRSRVPASDRVCSQATIGRLLNSQCYDFSVLFKTSFWLISEKGGTRRTYSQNAVEQLLDQIFPQAKLSAITHPVNMATI